MALKQAIIVRHDLKLPKGKLAAQVAHASTEAALKSSPDIMGEWREAGMKKIVLKVKDRQELLEFYQMAKDAGLVTSLIKDAGKTTLPPGTITCAAIGPDDEERIDRITGSLALV